MNISDVVSLLLSATTEFTLLTGIPHSIIVLLTYKGWGVLTSVKGLATRVGGASEQQ